MPVVSLPSTHGRRAFILPRRPRHSSAAISNALVRSSVGALTADRHDCRHCHRTPLVGERVHLYGADVVCELCLPLRIGAPDRSLLVRSPEQAGAVRTLRRET